MSFAQASPYIYIDPIVIDKAVKWILDQYDHRTGMFNEPGRILDKKMMVNI